MPATFYTNDIKTFQLGISLTKPSLDPNSDKSFKEVLDNQIKETTKKAEEKVSEVSKDEKGIQKKKDKSPGDLPDISKIIKNTDPKSDDSFRTTYLLLERFKSERKTKYDDPFSANKHKVVQNLHHAIGNPLIDPYGHQGQPRRMSRSQILSLWERMTPTVTEDPMKRSVRIDIPMLHDVQALVLRLHPDKSVSASLLGSEAMQELIKRNKDKLESKLKHHHLTLKEFNTYISETEFTLYSGTKKKKNKQKSRKVMDII